MQKVRFRHLQKYPPLYLAAGFLITILTGTFLLMSPVSSSTGVVTPFVDALFTATSATCVTGLTVFTTAKYWSLFGQVVILLLIQIGGLGFMAMTVLIAMLLHKKITLSDRLVIREQFGKDSLTGLVRWMQYIILATLAVEALGAVLLSTQLIPKYGVQTGLWYSVFHSISAFCNAGFDILGPTSLIEYRLNPVVMLTIGCLIIAGGLGFGVYLDLFRRRRRQLSLHTKLVLWMTAILLSAGTLLFYIIEGGNPGTMADLPVWGKWLAAFFQSVTTRTAGYFGIPQAGMYEISAVVSIMLMFIGGSPAGTSGGIKTTTFAVLLLGTRSQIRGDANIEIFNRSIPWETVLRALTIIMIGLLWVVAVSFAVSVIEKADYIVSLFETVSAFATVGLTIDFTPGLHSASKILLVATMYAGRVGPVTLAYALVHRKKQKDHSNAEGNVMVG